MNKLILKITKEKEDGIFWYYFAMSDSVKSIYFCARRSEKQWRDWSFRGRLKMMHHTKRRFRNNEFKVGMEGTFLRSGLFLPTDK